MLEHLVVVSTDTGVEEAIMRPAGFVFEIARELEVDHMWVPVGIDEDIGTFSEVKVDDPPLVHGVDDGAKARVESGGNAWGKRFVASSTAAVAVGEDRLPQVLERAAINVGVG